MAWRSNYIEEILFSWTLRCGKEAGRGKKVQLRKKFRMVSTSRIHYLIPRRHSDIDYSSPREISRHRGDKLTLLVLKHDVEILLLNVTV